MKEVVYGTSSVLAALRSNKRKVYRLLVSNSSDDSLDSNHETSGRQGSIATALELAQSRGIKVEKGNSGVFRNLPFESTHNGLALECSELKIASIVNLNGFDATSNSYEAVVSQKESLSFRFDNSSSKFPLWLCLDQINDPQNLGAIIRSATFFAVDGIVLTSQHSAPLSPVVSKASAGALETFDTLYSAKNLTSFLSTSKIQNWFVYGTDITNAKPKDVVSCFDVPPLEAPTILVVGSEGAGLRKQVSRCCDKQLVIPQQQQNCANAEDYRKGALDSLNVSVATGILLASLLRIRK